MKKFLSLLLIFTLLFSLCSSSFADVEPPWTENVEAHSTSSLHLQVHTAAVAAALAVKFGGPASNYLWIGISFISSAYTANQDNVYYKVKYYWRSSGDL